MKHLTGSLKTRINRKYLYIFIVIVAVIAFAFASLPEVVQLPLLLLAVVSLSVVLEALLFGVASTRQAEACERHHSLRHFR
ncbi:hypothetical protein CS022_08060 [Veronia nyctiphanis]|uniref:Uncharacterized protein n=1 Tax=Veronia nyctiphanis TaxID=1278244 RepID=A0A4Q0YSL9_9GAMM|nr:hypothetical protein [Veronia nyctiphanis]RXJ73685.1 hypothetical protein CS022_08060 [Veronia nyctiphanis]